MPIPRHSGLVFQRVAALARKKPNTDGDGAFDGSTVALRPAGAASYESATPARDSSDRANREASRNIQISAPAAP
jgi:hypothetical protein